VRSITSANTSWCLHWHAGTRVFVFALAPIFVTLAAFSYDDEADDSWAA
jgi:hypothetical protein